MSMRRYELLIQQLAANRHNRVALQNNIREVEQMLQGPIGPAFRKSAQERRDGLLDYKRILEEKLVHMELWLQLVEGALGQLSCYDRDILLQLLVRPAPGAADTLCRKLGIAKSTLYRHRKLALQRFAEHLERR